MQYEVTKHSMAFVKDTERYAVRSKINCSILWDQNERSRVEIETLTTLT